MIELFEISASPSPRLKWIGRHGIWTKHFASTTILKDLSWVAMAIGKSASGPTEDDAIVALANKMGIRIWNEE